MSEIQPEQRKLLDEEIDRYVKEWDWAALRVKEDDDDVVE